MAITTRSYSADDFTFRVPITFSGDPINLSAAGVEVLAQGARGGEPITGSGSMEGPAEVRGGFPDGAFTAGVYRVQVRCTLGDTTQTVAEWLHTVSPSL